MTWIHSGLQEHNTVSNANVLLTQLRYLLPPSSQVIQEQKVISENWLHFTWEQWVWQWYGQDGRKRRWCWTCVLPHSRKERNARRKKSETMDARWRDEGGKVHRQVLFPFFLTWLSFKLHLFISSNPLLLSLFLSDSSFSSFCFICAFLPLMHSTFLACYWALTMPPSIP